MIELSRDLISSDLFQKITHLRAELESFRETALDPVALAKLREHFRTQHIFHSSGIEGNRLTLQETSLVLREGIDISGKPLKDSIEVRNLGKAFDCLYELSNKETPISENYLMQMHQLLIGDDESLSPGKYRNIGVTITGSDHRPPEPFEVPIQMGELVDWINNENEFQEPIITAAVAHHEMVRIHPFKDGNGRTARLLLNLILLKAEFPICNIKRTERPDYYNALSSADEGEYEPIIEIVTNNCTSLFEEYIRVRDESNRLKNWTEKVGKKDLEQWLAKQKTEFELWLNRINQIKLEFRLVFSSLNENLVSHYITFYEYSQITFDKYQELKEKGIAPNTNFFSIRFHNRDTRRIVSALMFRFHRSASKCPEVPDAIPLELNIYDSEEKSFKFIGYSNYDKITLRAFYVSNKNDIIVRHVDPKASNPNWEDDKAVENLAAEIQTFAESVLDDILGISSV